MHFLRGTPDLGQLPDALCTKQTFSWQVAPSNLTFLVFYQILKGQTDVKTLLAACNPNACRASGRGLQPKGVRIRETADFKVDTKAAGSGELGVTVKGPSKYSFPHVR